MGLHSDMNTQNLQNVEQRVDDAYRELIAMKADGWPF